MNGKKYKSFKEYISQNYSLDDLRAMVRHGCGNAAIGGMINYKETTALYNQYHDDIWDMLNEDTENYVHPNIFSFLYEEIDESDAVTNDEQFKNLLVWYAVERIARKELDGE